MTVTKANGDSYEPNTLRGFMASFDRQLRRHNYGEYLSSGNSFAKVREVLKCKQKQLKREGKGYLSHRADPISDEEIGKLWQSGEFGSGTPDSIFAYCLVLPHCTFWATRPHRAPRYDLG